MKHTPKSQPLRPWKGRIALLETISVVMSIGLWHGIKDIFSGHISLNELLFSPLLLAVIPLFEIAKLIIYIQLNKQKGENRDIGILFWSKVFFQITKIILIILAFAKIFPTILFTSVMVMPTILFGTKMLRDLIKMQWASFGHNLVKTLGHGMAGAGFFMMLFIPPLMPVGFMLICGSLLLRILHLTISKIIRKIKGSEYLSPDSTDNSTFSTNNLPKVVRASSPLEPSHIKNNIFWSCLKLVVSI